MGQVAFGPNGSITGLSDRAAAAKAYAAAERLLKLQHKIARDLLAIDGEKDALRQICETAGTGYTIEVGELGTVELKAGREAEVTGTSPQLIVAAFLGLSEARRNRLVYEGVVEIVDVVKKAAKPSVTVRL